MPRVFRTRYTVPIPEGAKRVAVKGVPHARFVRNGKAVAARVVLTGKNAGQRATVEAPYYTAEYTDAAGRPRRVKAYSDKRSSEAYAEELQRGADREKAGIIDQESIDLSASVTGSIEAHTAAYKANLKAAGVSDWHLSETMRRLKAIVQACGFKRLLDIKAEPVQKWLNKQATAESETGKGMGARTRNTYSGSLRAFVRWCVADGRMPSDPLVTLKKADESADVRRKRRALTEDEIADLIRVAQGRPLADALMVRRGKRKGELAAKLRSEVRARLERLGWERALIYQTLILTGLRRGELADLRWADLDLDDTQAWLTVRASISKNGKEETLPLRNDLAQALKAWRVESGNPGDGAPVFVVPKGLVHILARDIKAAGIDLTGIDVHSLRHTTATHLAKAGVAPRTAQAILRHSDIRLTYGVYTDPKLLETVKAVDALPQIGPKATRERRLA